MAKLKQVSKLPYHEYRVGLVKAEADRLADIWGMRGTDDVTIQELMRSIVLLWMQDMEKRKPV